MSARQLVYLFEAGTAATRTPEIRGGKGAGLAVMVAEMNLPVPPGFTITTSAARGYAERGELPKRLTGQIHRSLLVIERRAGKQFGATNNPLLVSVRSGAAVSMPGMMDTVLNVGLNDQIAEAFALQQGECFAFQSYHRLLSMFGETVLRIDKREFTDAETATKLSTTTSGDDQLSGLALRALCEVDKDIIAARSGQEFPQDPLEQLSRCIFAVFDSWSCERAVAYRQSQNIPDWLGTAVTVQSMVFGNRDARSGTGVVFSRNPQTGEPGMFGNFAPQTQGEDIVNGSITPLPIKEMQSWNAAAYAELDAVVRRLEEHNNDIVDVEFTVESQRLYILQQRSAKRTAQAAARFAVDGVNEGKWRRRDAVNMLTAPQVDLLHRRQFDPIAVEAAHRLVQGTPASDGAVVGTAVFDCQRAIELAKAGQKIVLFRPDTSPDDLPAMLASAAIVTGKGGPSCHAAVVARGLGIPAVVGCASLSFASDRAVTTDGAQLVVADGDVVSVDGSTGGVYLGAVGLVSPQHSAQIRQFLSWHKRFAVKMPPARVDFDRIQEVVNANTRLNDIYLLETMKVACRINKSLHDRIERVCARFQAETAETFACYLAVAVAGELRHTLPRQVRLDSAQRAAWSTLQSIFSAGASSERAVAQHAVISALKMADTAAHEEFFNLAAVVFANNWKSNSVGGPAWARIAEAPAQFLSGRLNHLLFIDRVFDLQHNGDKLFDKHPMVASDERLLKRQLDAKKSAPSLDKLYAELMQLHKRLSPEVAGAWDEGHSIGLW